MSAVTVVYEPSVYVLARQAVDPAELARLLGDHGSPGWSTDAAGAGEAVVEVCGRLCYDSFARPRPGGNRAYIRHILEVQHGSVTEHAVWTLVLTGVSRSLTHELVRHRVGLSPSQLSQRYVDEGGVAFVAPPALVDEIKLAVDLFRSSWLTPDHSRDEADCLLADDLSAGERVGVHWVRAAAASLEAYALLSAHLAGKGGGAPAGAGRAATTDRRKRAREAARSVLPNCAETKIALTGNARAWRHLLEMRGSGQADAEFRRLALKLHPVLLAEAPALFGDYEVRAGEDGPYLHTEFRKV